MRPPNAEMVALLFCDDIRTEQSGRLSLMGLYGPTLEVEALPAIAASLSAVLIIREPREALTEAVVSLTDASGIALISPSKQAIDIGPGGEKTTHQISLKVMPFPLNVEGPVVLKYSFNGGTEIGIEAAVTVRVKPPQPS